MNRFFPARILAGIWLVLSLAAQAGQAPVTQLHALFDAEWERSLREDPVSASYLGDARYAGLWPDRSLSAIAASHAADQAALQALHRIDRATLSVTDQISYDLFARQIKEAIEAYAFRRFLAPLDQRGGIQTQDELAEVLPFATQADYVAWLQRLEALPVLIEQTMELMRTGIREGRLMPKVVMQRVPAQIEKQIVADAADSPFYKPLRQMPAGIDPRQSAQLRRQAERLIGKGVVPAYRRFLEFFTREYLPACPDDPGIWAQPDGDALYAFLVRRYTTTALTPAQVHDIGLAEVARIEGDMHKVLDEVGFDGTLAEFNASLRKDPRFYYTTGAELLEGYQALAKRIDGELPRLFRTMPRLPYGVRAVPDNIAPDTTTAYYLPGAADGSRAGFYYANLYRPETRPKYEMEALTLHEAVPGHHFQIARAQELTGLPQFRKNGWGMTAFVEGWGLYAESLGPELGLYRDPYSRYGALTYEMWRAVRLVVDTGIHAKHWTRQQAIDYFMAHTAKSELDVVNEIDRYIAWPGQALAYKIGELKIRELRTRAEQALGTAFDVRAFHDAVLEQGAVPLDVLERQIDLWIRTQQRD